MIFADANDLIMWANRRYSQDHLPRLVRRLIHATVPDVTRIGLPADDAVQSGGWDGVVVATKGNAYVPAGLSCWELGTNKDVKGKADDDYNKRTADPLGVDPKDTAFIFVTPRRWGNKDVWAAERRKEAVWQDVRAYDADDLVAWLEAAPPVHIWFSNLIGKSPAGVTDLTTAWRDWSEATEPILTPELLTASRDDAVKTLSNWLVSGSGVLALQAETRREAVAFCSAVLLSMPSEERIAVLARAAIVNDPQAWAQLAAADNPALLIPMFVDRNTVTSAARRGHQVLVPLDLGDREDDDALVLERPHRESITAALAKMGFGGRTLEVHATLVRNSLSAFRRKIAVSSSVSRPEWAEPSEAAAIVPALLAGSWDDAYEVDRSAIEVLSRMTYADCTTRLTRWLNAADSPIRRTGNTWRIIAKEDAWKLLVPSITSDDMAAFEKTALDVLAIGDAKINMTVGEALVYDLRERSSRPSDGLREGIADTLAMLGTAKIEFSDATRSIDWADRAIRLLFERTKADWTIWSTLSDLLPLIAEASPTAIMSALEDALAGDAPPLLNLFPKENEQNPMFAPHPHTGVLWALESLAWSAEHLARASLILARLAEIDPTPDSNFINRPRNSLRDIFVWWLPHTNASLEQQLEVIDLLRARKPVMAWELLLRLLPSGYEVTKMTHTPTWQDWFTDVPKPASAMEQEAAISAIAERVVADSAGDAKRWVDVFPRLAQLPAEHRNRILSEAESVDPDTICSSDRVAAWNALRTTISRHREYADSTSASSDATVYSLERIYHALTPGSIGAQYSWLFTRRPALLHPQRHDWRAYDEAVSSERVASVRNAYNNVGIGGVMDIAAVADLPYLVGDSLANADVTGSADDIRIVGELAQEFPNLRSFARGYAAARMIQLGWEWADRILAECDHLSSAATRAEFYAVLPFDDSTWDRVDREPEDVQSGYWSVAGDRISGIASCERAMANQLRYGRPLAALALAAQNSQQEMQIKPALIVAALQDLVNNPLPEELDYQWLSYSIGELLDKLEATGDIDVGVLATLEWAYQPLLRHDHGTKVLHAELERSPAFFVDLISLIFVPDDQEAEAAPIPTETDKIRADRAYELLDTWAGLPGIRDDRTVDAEVLGKWVQMTRSTAVTAGVVHQVDIFIGKLFSRSPEAVAGSWPCAEISEIIESVASRELDGGFKTQTYNNRGVYTKSDLEGGEQETELESKYRQFASVARNRWPRVATLLSEVADSFGRLARFSDREAAIEEDSR